MSEEKQKNTSLLVKTNSEGLTGSTASASRPRNLVHSVSIIVETVLDDYEVPTEVEEEIGVQKRIDDCQTSSLDHDIEELQKRQFFRTGRHQSTPIIFREDHVPGAEESEVRNNRVQSIIATARLRKAAFAKLLEEHAELVNEINRAETSLV